MTEPFDLEAWITGARAPERSCTVYGRGDLVAEAERLAAEIAEADRSRDPERMNSGAAPALRKRLDEVRAEFEGSALEFRFRAPTRDEIRKAQEEIGEESDDEAFTFALMSLQAVLPKPSPQQWPAIRDRIGTGQFQLLIDTANGAYGDQRLDIPFSRATSGRTRV